MPACAVRYYVMGGVGPQKVSGPGRALDVEAYGPVCLTINTNSAASKARLAVVAQTGIPPKGPAAAGQRT